MSDMTLHFRCHKCKFLDVVDKNKAKEWKCPNCEMKMKYKPCCSRRCLKHGCITREEGGCICLCSLFDHLNSLKRVQEGYMVKVGMGMIYYPNLNMAREMGENLPEKDKCENQKYLESIPERIKEVEDRIKEYENPAS